MLFMLDFVCIIFDIIQVYGMNCIEELSYNSTNDVYTLDKIDSEQVSNFVMEQT